MENLVSGFGVGAGVVVAAGVGGGAVVAGRVWTGAGFEVLASWELWAARVSFEQAETSRSEPRHAIPEQTRALSLEHLQGLSSIHWLQVSC